MRILRKSIALCSILVFSIASFASALVPEIEDVSVDDWFSEYVVTGWQLGLVKGTSEDTLRFEPNRDVTRGEFITALGRLHELSGEEIDTNLDDRHEHVDMMLPAYYTAYVAWAAENEIIQGYGDGSFGPDDPITREQMAVVIANYIEVYDLHERFETYLMPQFEDLDDISTWATEAADKMHQYAIISGDDNYFFRPQDHCSRAEMTKVLVKMCDSILDFSVN